MKAKRIVVDVNEDFFWQFKAKCAELKVNQNVLGIIAMRQMVNPEYPLNELITDQELLKTLQTLGIE